MKLIELNNTFSRFNKIKKDLTKLMVVISSISMVLFALYYVYLISINFDNLVYLIIYSVLFLTIISLFIIENSLNESDSNTRKGKRIIIEKKRKYKKITKIPKYIAKFGLVGVAMFEMVGNFAFSFSNVVNILLVVLLIIQILMEVIVHYVVKYIDYIKLSIDQDLNESLLVKVFRPKQWASSKVEDLSYAINGESKYTDSEIKMINEIKEEKKEYEQQKNEEIKNTTASSLKRMIDKLKTRKDSK